jgi:large subunit ribosomal protein L4
MSVTIPIFDMKGAEKGTVEVAESLIVREKGDQAVKDAVVAHLRNRRQGTACTKTRGEVAGSGAKPWRQKGTGRARAGSRRSPLWRHGGVTFGPRPRSYEWRLPQQIRTLALQRSFSDRVLDGDVIIVESISPQEPKTKGFVSTLASLNVGDNILILVDTVDTNLRLASRNLPKVDVIRACDISTYMMLLHKKVVMTQAAYDVLVQRFKKEDAE